MQSVALVPKCVECEARWLPADAERWQAHLGVDESLDERAEVVLLCPECAEREFGNAARRLRRELRQREEIADVGRHGGRGD